MTELTTVRLTEKQTLQVKQALLAKDHTHSNGHKGCSGLGQISSALYTHTHFLAHG